MTMPEAPEPQRTPRLKEHRGTLVLVFGILGWVFCTIFAILAWVWGKEDLREMDAGRMDPSGRGLTHAGYLLGMIHVIAVGVLLFFALLAGLASVLFVRK